jgi:predicted transcriptional regulator
MARKKRTNNESRAFKAEIADLKRQGKTNAEICRELGVTRQYVSAVLIEAGLAEGKKRRAPKQTKDSEPHVISLIDRLEQKGNQGLAEVLRGVLGRNGKVKGREGNGTNQG